MRPACAADSSTTRDDGIENVFELQRRAHGLADLTERTELPDRARQLLRPRFELDCHAIELRRQPSELVAVRDLDPLREIARRNESEMRVHELHRPEERPGDRVAQHERQCGAPDRETDHDPAGCTIGIPTGIDAGRQVDLALVDEVVGEALEPIGERAGLGELQLPALGDASSFPQLGNTLGHLDELVIGCADAAEKLGVVRRRDLELVELIPELGELPERCLDRVLVPGPGRR